MTNNDQRIRIQAYKTKKYKGLLLLTFCGTKGGAPVIVVLKTTFGMMSYCLLRASNYITYHPNHFVMSDFRRHLKSAVLSFTQI